MNDKTMSAGELVAALRRACHDCNPTPCCEYETLGDAAADLIEAKEAELARVTAERDALKRYVDGEVLAMVTEIDGVPLAHLRELAEAEREGRCVVLPCKIGDTAFVLESEDEDGGDDCIFEGNIVAIHIGTDGITVTIGHMEKKCWFSETERRVSDLNVDWFLNSEEAQAAQGGSRDALS